MAKTTVRKPTTNGFGTAKSFPATRKFSLRRDATVRAGEKTIARVFGLPPGSVQLMLPSGKVARSDKQIGDCCGIGGGSR